MWSPTLFYLVASPRVSRDVCLVKTSVQDPWDGGDILRYATVRQAQLNQNNEWKDELIGKDRWGIEMHCGAKVVEFE
ncbi:hypothetical protein TNCV_4400611 [Trichonephila clavipes]|nr:hypothetical protein TNCV_4400611 [Trichonephila clavipes]